MSIDTSTETTAEAKPEPAGPSRAALMWRGTRTATTALRTWMRADDYAGDVKRNRSNGTDGKIVEYSKSQHQIVVANRQQFLVNILRIVLAFLTGGWWPATAVYFAAAALSCFLWTAAEKGPTRERALVGLKAGAAAFVISLSIGLLNTWAAGAAFGWTWANTGWLTLTTLILGGWFVRAIWDGDAGNDLPVEVRNLAAPAQVAVTAPNTVRALGKAVGAKTDAAAVDEVTIIGTPALDARGIWTRTHFQLTTRPFADLERKTTPAPMQAVAAAMRKPSGWVFVERTGDDESQGLLYVANACPWPATPRRWAGLDSLQHDAWTPTVIGTDMLTGQDYRMAAAETSDMCGASPGGGKTAWTRRDLCLTVADPFVDNVLMDFKGDGALVAFEPGCSFYVDGDDDEAFRGSAEWLNWFRHTESARRKAELKKLVQARLAPDAKVTREIARNAEYNLKLMVVNVDEAQEGIKSKKYGKDISEGLTYLAKQGRSLGARLKVRTQKPTDDPTGIPAALNSMLPTRIAGRAEAYQVSMATLLSSTPRADQMPEGVKGLFYLRLPGGSTAKIISDYVDTVEATDYVQRVLEHQRGAGLIAAPVTPVVPRILTELHRLLSEPSRDGRMRSVEVAAAMAANGIITVTDADRTGHEKTEDQIRQEKVADLLRPWNVRTRPDSSVGNAMSYWLVREHRDHGDVGVIQGLRRAETGDRYAGVGNGNAGSPAGSSEGSRRLRMVRGA